ncbi:CCQ_1a_G0052270.mRNA.1.CDS.1 [Saccharomyces cerevisiae]|nr:CCQ_1a_G0017560.mRNA.1.CDS.1 [Saccharomyces cerevisiae]CAI4823491.1 CCQ_1a_G0052260.mRNA.1.CDS.1 [Saccharomyces cerevisiae]CAI4824079.1 CCQ_1a_G0052270.mRNA.1.CDS.1 [Saccharomyces cerevisiae]CAI7276630.1 CCQ_1a_G0017560.mRNA.1.CDS.1 [Saccharomyces cerevisiae]CAI7469864.1 CCQ_1a_G0052260.mRNA.1.CDS.1 [Saccharomyces cerevisiae]
MIVNNTHILTPPLYTTTSPNAILTCTCILIGHTHTGATVYTTLKLTLLSHSTPLHGPSLISSVLDALTSLCTALASAVYTLCHLPITPMIIHILISISHSATPNIV